jgi:O-antigen biosynthesis protein WbqP
MYERFGKRLVDLLLSGVAAIVLLPVLLVTGLAIRMDDGRPVIYRQLRIGRDARPFTIFKFRSMPLETEIAPSAGMGTARVTRVGRLIRRLNVDELPQIFNILRGDMAVVGPRPALESQTTLIAERSSGRAMRLRPGLTGLAQVNAYDGMPEEVKSKLDNEYAESVSLVQDLKIIAATVAYLFKTPPTY